MEVIRDMGQNWIKVKKLFADGGYTGKLIEKVKTAFNIDIEVVKRNKQNKFEVLPKRWIVESTFAWIDTNRRNSKNYERLDQTSVAMVHLSAIRIMLNRF